MMYHASSNAHDFAAPKAAVLGISGGDRVQALLEIVSTCYPDKVLQISLDLLMHGEASAPGGMLRRPKNFWPVLRESSPVDDLMVSAFMQLAAPEGFAYNNQRQIFEKVGSPETKPAEFSQDHFEQALARFFPADTACIAKSFIKDPETLHDALERAIRTGSAPVCLRVRWATAENPDGCRSFIATKVDDGKVFFTDPRGRDETAAPGQSIVGEGLARTVENGPEGSYSALIEQVFEKLDSVVLDRNALKPESRPAQSWLLRATSWWASINPPPRNPKIEALRLAFIGSWMSALGAVAVSPRIAESVWSGIDCVLNQPLVQRASNAAEHSYHFFSSLKMPKGFGWSQDTPDAAATLATSAPGQAPAEAGNPQTTRRSANPTLSPAPKPPAAQAAPKRATGTLKSLFKPGSNLPREESDRTARDRTVNSTDIKLNVGQRFEAIKAEATPLILEELSRHDEVFGAIDLKAVYGVAKPEKKLDSLKVLSGTLSDYRAVWERIAPSGEQSRLLQEHKNGWVDNPSGQLAKYKEAYGEVAAIRRSAVYDAVRDGMRPRLQKLLAPVKAQLESIQYPVPPIKLDTSDEVIETMCAFRKAMSANKPRIERGEKSGLFSLSQVINFSMRIETFRDRPNDLNLELIRQQKQ